MHKIYRIALVAFVLMAASVAMTSCKKSNYEEKLRLEMEARLEREREQMQSQQAATPAQSAQPVARPAAQPAASAAGTNATVIQEGGYTNVRSGAGSSYSIVEKIKDGSPIRVGRNVNGWYEVLNAQGGLRGYMHASKVVFGGQAAAAYAPAPRGAKLSPQDMMTAVVKPEGGYTNVRQGPGTSYGIVTKVPDGGDIFCNATDFNTASWVKVYDLNMNFLGYISRSKLIAR